MLVRPLSTVDNTLDYARVSHSRQWSNNNNSIRNFEYSHSTYLANIIIVSSVH